MPVLFLTLLPTATLSLPEEWCTTCLSTPNDSGKASSEHPRRGTRPSRFVQQVETPNRLHSRTQSRTDTRRGVGVSVLFLNRYGIHSPKLASFWSIR